MDYAIIYPFIDRIDCLQHEHGRPSWSRADPQIVQTRSGAPVKLETSQSVGRWPQWIHQHVPTTLRLPLTVAFFPVSNSHHHVVSSWLVVDTMRNERSSLLLLSAIFDQACCCRRFFSSRVSIHDWQFFIQDLLWDWFLVMSRADIWCDTKSTCFNVQDGFRATHALPNGHVHIVRDT